MTPKQLSLLTQILGRLEGLYWGTENAVLRGGIGNTCELLAGLLAELKEGGE